MKAKRQRHQSAFKAKVGLEALLGIKTVAEIAREYQVHPTQVFLWEEVETTRSVAGTRGALPDSCGDGSLCSGRRFPTFHIQALGAFFFQKIGENNTVITFSIAWTSILRV